MIPVTNISSEDQSFDVYYSEICGQYLQKRFTGITRDTRQLIKELWLSNEFTENYPELFSKLKQKFIWQSIMQRYAIEAEMNPFTIYQFLDQTLMSFIRAFAPHELAEQVPKIVFSKLLNKSAMERSKYINSFIERSSASTMIKILVQDLCDFQADLVNSMVSPSASYEKRILDCTHESTIYSIFEQVFLNCAAVLDNFASWDIRLTYCLDNYASDLIHIVAQGEIPERLSPELVLALARLKVRFDHLPVDIPLGCKAREVLFFLLSARKLKGSYPSEKAKYGINSMKSDLATVSMDHKGYIGMFRMISYKLKCSIFKMWERMQRNKAALEKIINLSHCLYYIGVAINDLDNRFELLDEKSKHYTIALSDVTSATLKIYLVANEMLMTMIPEDAENKPLLEKHLTNPLELKFGFSQTAEIIYNILESEYNKLYRTDKVLACGLFRFLELSRGLALLGDKLLERFESMCLGEIDKLYVLSLEYIKYCLRNGVIKVNTLDISKFVLMSAQVSTNFGKLISLNELPKQADHAFYNFLRSKAKSIENDFFWSTISKWLDERDAEMLGSWNSNVMKTQKGQHRKTRPKPVKNVSSATSVKLTKAKGRSLIENEGSTNTMSSPNLLATDEPPKQRIEIKSPSEESAIVPVARDPVSSIASVENAVTLVDPVQTVPTVRAYSPLNLEEKKALADLRQIWEGSSKFLFPNLNSISIPRPLPLKRNPLALTYTALEEPKHHAMLAKTVGHKEGKVDSRDYLMALILVGERCWIRLQPFVSILGTYNGYLALSEMFKEDIWRFKEEVEMLAEVNSAMLNELLEGSNILDLRTLLKYIDYYQLRVKVAHPLVPTTKPLREFTAIRHLSTLETLEVLETGKLRKYLSCGQYIPIKKLDTIKGRPTKLLDSRNTEITLAIIGLYEITKFLELKTQRNVFAHQVVDNSTFIAYIDYIFAESPDFNILRKL